MGPWGAHPMVAIWFWTEPWLLGSKLPENQSALIYLFKNKYIASYALLFDMTNIGELVVLQFPMVFFYDFRLAFTRTLWHIRITWKTMWPGKTCFTQLTTYSVSCSVSSSGLADDLNNGPNLANSGIALSCSETQINAVRSKLCSQKKNIQRSTRNKKEKRIAAIATLKECSLFIAWERGLWWNYRVS